MNQFRVITVSHPGGMNNQNDNPIPSYGALPLEYCHGAASMVNYFETCHIGVVADQERSGPKEFLKEAPLTYM